MLIHPFIDRLRRGNYSNINIPRNSVVNVVHLGLVNKNTIVVVKFSSELANTS